MRSELRSNTDATFLFLGCVEDRARELAAADDRASRREGAILSALGGPLMSLHATQADAYERRPVTCTTGRVGNYLDTNC